MAHLHEGGGGGITTIAMAGLDLALWDLAPAARASASPTTSVAGTSRRVYGSGVNLHYPLDELVGAGATLVDAASTR